jgi:UDP-3-O-[3-hydroxymyristoyl] glucosamine N-acyltransferase
MAIASFFKPGPPILLSDLCAMLGIRCPPGREHVPVNSVDVPSRACEGDLCFVSSAKFAASLETMDGVIVLLPAALAGRVPSSCTELVHERPAAAFSAAARHVYPDSLRQASFSGLVEKSPGVFIHPTARIERGVELSPGITIAAGVEIGSGTRVAPGVRIASGSAIGRNCDIGANVSIQCALIGDRVVIGPGSSIGHDGFGYVPGAAGLEKVPQLGRVILQNGVELGANVCVDRGALDDTVIGEGTKIDNLVQVAHNVKIGRHSVVAALSGFSGSVSIGDGAMIGGQVGVADHVSIGRGARIAAQSGVMSDVPAGDKQAGVPARPARRFFREVVALSALAAKGSPATKPSDKDE